MVRPRLPRRISFEPSVSYFKPLGVPLRDLDEEVLTKDELEAIRLIDFEEIEQKKAAIKMKISQPTFSRMLKSARKKISSALINGKAIKIHGRDYEVVFKGGFGRGGLGRGGFRQGDRRGFGGGRGKGLGGGRGFGRKFNK